MSTAIFEADPEGFRSQQAGRPAAHLVRELVQNAMDEDGVMNLDVLVTYHGSRRGTTVVVRDDAPAGVTDPKLLFTVWLSNKEDSVTKRGRMGRGLKELVSVCDETVIRSCGIDALSFERFAGGRWERKSKPKLGRTERGTEVTAFCRSWGEKAAKSIVDFLQRIRAPGSITMRVSYSTPEAPGELQQVRPFVATERYNLCLTTVLFEQVDGARVERERSKCVDVECFTPPPGEKAYVYEMGIPVEECESPVSIDVGQRVVLRERRDTLTESYKRELYAKVLSERIGKLEHDDMLSNATIIATQSSWYLSNAAKKRIVEAHTGGLPFASSPKAFQHATGHHVECVTLRSLPESVRALVKDVGTDVQTVLDSRRGEFNPQVTDLTVDQRRLITLWEWIAKGIGRPCTVIVRNGAVAMADFSRSDRVLSLYTGGGCNAAFFKAPLRAKQLGTLIHELSHWIDTRENEHGSEFNADTEDVGGSTASFLFENAEQARLMLKAPLTQNAAIEAALADEVLS